MTNDITEEVWEHNRSYGAMHGHENAIQDISWKVWLWESLLEESRQEGRDQQTHMTEPWVTDALVSASYVAATIQDGFNNIKEFVILRTRRHQHPGEAYEPMGWP